MERALAKSAGLSGDLGTTASDMTMIKLLMIRDIDVAQVLKSTTRQGVSSKDSYHDIARAYQKYNVQDACK